MRSSQAKYEGMTHMQSKPEGQSGARVDRHEEDKIYIERFDTL